MQATGWNPFGSGQDTPTYVNGKPTLPPWMRMPGGPQPLGSGLTRPGWPQRPQSGSQQPMGALAGQTPAGSMQGYQGAGGAGDPWWIKQLQEKDAASRSQRQGVEPTPIPQRQQQLVPTWMQPQQPQQQPFSGVFNPQQTQEASNRARNAFAGTTIPMLLQQSQRPGIRADSMLPSVLPQYAQAQADGQFAAQMIPFQHAQANAQQQMGMENQDWRQSLGMANQNLIGQNQLNQYGLGNMQALADFFRLFL